MSKHKFCLISASFCIFTWFFRYFIEFSGYGDDTAVFIVVADVGPIVGSVVGILILLFLIGGVIFFIRR